MSSATRIAELAIAATRHLARGCDPVLAFAFAAGATADQQRRLEPACVGRRAPGALARSSEYDDALSIVRELTPPELAAAIDAEWVAPDRARAAERARKDKEDREERETRGPRAREEAARGLWSSTKAMLADGRVSEQLRAMLAVDITAGAGSIALKDRVDRRLAEQLERALGTPAITGLDELERRCDDSDRPHRRRLARWVADRLARRILGDRAALPGPLADRVTGLLHRLEGLGEAEARSQMAVLDPDRQFAVGVTEMGR